MQNAVLSSQKTSRAGSQVGDVGEVQFPRTSWNSTSTHFSGATPRRRTDTHLYEWQTGRTACLRGGDR